MEVQVREWGFCVDWTNLDRRFPNPGCSCLYVFGTLTPLHYLACGWAEYLYRRAECRTPPPPTTRKGGNHPPLSPLVLDEHYK